MEQHRRRRRRRKRVYSYRYCVIAAVLFMALALSMVKCGGGSRTASRSPSVNKTISEFASEHDLPTDAWPEKLIKLLERNPETKEFVLNYPLKKDLKPEINLDEYKNSKGVPLLLQWDERWGYNEYAGDLMGLSGCGPTCLSMVCVYLLRDTACTPEYVAAFAEKNGYSVSGNGSAWSLISDGGEQLGLEVTEIPLVEHRVIQNLEVGNPIICIMGPGDFTTTGHFIVMTEYVDGKIRINDPNSIERSNQLWELSAIKHQIRNLWVCRK